MSTDILIQSYGITSVYISGLFILHVIVYWIVSGIFSLIDIYKPVILMKYKIQNHSQQINTTIINKLIKQVLVNQLISVFIALLFLKLYIMRGFETSQETIPSIMESVFHFSVFLLIEEIGFYYLHRLAHYGLFYKNIHKQHHEWITPIAITAIYCHPLEHIFINLIPLFIGPLIMKSHLVLIWIWVFIATINTVYSHSGYSFKYMYNKAHDYHHLYFRECFGILQILDTINETNTN